jgi:hypothetical protein
MKRPATTDELERVRNLTEQCMEQVLIAKKQSAKFVEYYVASAEEFRRRASRTRFREIRAMLSHMAELHQSLAGLGQRAEEALDHEPVAHEAASPAIATKQDEEAVRHGSDEDAVAQARRHVAEAEDRIARQEALLARLSQDYKHPALVVEAREILSTLKHSLDLARDHLALELRK